MSTQTSSGKLTLEYVKTIGIVNNGYNGRGFANPYDVAVTKDGRIFVLNRCDPARAAGVRIGVCTLDEEYLTEFSSGYGGGDGQWVLPVAMELDSQERLYVTDEHNSRITIHSTDGEFVGQWGVEGSGDGELDGPAGIGIDSDDNVYIVDQNNNRVQKFSSEGTYLLQWGTEGSGDGQFNLPWGLAVDSDNNVYVADWRNDRIQKFSSDGTYIATIGESGAGDGQLSRPSGVAVDGNGNVYVADWGNERIQVFGADGGLLLKLRGEATLSKWAEDYFSANPDEVATRDIADMVPELPAHLNTPYLISSQIEPYFWGPVSVSFDNEGRVYIPETNRHRVQVYQIAE